MRDEIAFIPHCSSFFPLLCYYGYARHADVAELVDALDLGSSFARSEGSSPFIRIILIVSALF